jgi:hypothetical protein
LLHMRNLTVLNFQNPRPALRKKFSPLVVTLISKQHLVSYVKEVEKWCSLPNHQ